MPVFEFTQREVTTHRIVVRADSEEEAIEFAGGLCDDEFPYSDTDWEDTDYVEVDEDSEVDEDLTDSE
jgi:hypothetical protein